MSDLRFLRKWKRRSPRGRTVLGLLAVQLLILYYVLQGEEPSSLMENGFRRIVRNAAVVDDDCSIKNIPRAGSPCRVAVISTWPPARCGIAEFSKELLDALRAVPEFSSQCDVEVLPVVPFHDNNKKESYPGEVGQLIIDDVKLPFESFYRNNLEYIRRRQFTHVVIQQEFGLTSLQWQLNDIARWLAPFVHVITVVHTPRAYPSIEETGLVRQLADNSKYLVVMSWHAVHSLVHAYGIERSKIVFIPHGVAIPSATTTFSVTHEEAVSRSSSSSFSLFPPELQRKDTLIAMSFGLIHEHKGLHRVVRIMKSIVESFPHFYFVIAGTEHPGSTSPVMPSLLEQAKAAGVERHIVWINRYLSRDEVDWLHRRADVILSLYDDVTPISGTLLKAMSYGRAIIATHYRFAKEVLQGGGGGDNERGCLVPFDDDQATRTCFVKVLGNEALRNEMSAKALEFVSRWSWEAVARQYANLLFLAASSSSSTSHHRPHCSLTEDPFHSPSPSSSFSPHQPLFENTRLQWIENEIQLFDRRLSVGREQVPRDGTIVLYVDHVLQVNAKVNEQQKTLVALSVETPTLLALVNVNGADVEFKPNTELSPYESLSHESSQILLQSLNVHLRVAVVERRLEFLIHRVNRFVAPRGVFGAAITSHYDLSSSYRVSQAASSSQAQRNLDLFRDVHLSSSSANILFSHHFPCQRWSLFGIDVNVYRLAAHNIPPLVFTLVPPPEKNVTFTIEGPLFNLESFAKVNRQMFLQLYWTHVQVLLKPTDTHAIVDVESTTSVAVALVSGAFSLQTKTEIPTTDILFRNSWPPNFQRPEERDGTRRIKYVHQQPWEYTSIPKSWVSPLLTVVDELWVPTPFSRDVYIDNYIDASKIHVIPHGVSVKKSQLMKQQKIRLETTRSFVFLFLGGLLPRKGIDVLLKAYTTAFSGDDDVALLIHSIYDDPYHKDNIRGFLRMRHQLPLPEIVFREAPLAETQLAQLLDSVDALVSPFRSEGDALIILEAMSKGVVPILPSSSSLDASVSSSEVLFAEGNSSAFFVGTALKDCVGSPPCGTTTASLFGEPTVQQAQWGEPSVTELAAALRLVYQSRHQKTQRGAQAQREASKHTWDAVGRQVLERIDSLLLVP